MRLHEMKKAFPSKAGLAVTATLVGLILLCALVGLAQSGRRVKKSTPLPPVPTPEASPTPTPRKTPDQPAIPILVGANTFDTYGNIPSYFTETVVKSCAEGLQQRSAVRAEVSSRDMTRGDAVKRAKEAKEGFVVLLELRSDQMRSGGTDSDYSRIYIEYSAFAGGTGRPVTSGSVYQQAGARDIILGRRESGAEQRLKSAARVVAQRILGAIGGR